MSQNAIIMARNGNDSTFEYVRCDDDGKLSVNLTGQNVDVKVIDKVDISGYTFNNDKLKVDISGQTVDISGSVSVLSLPAINITNTSFEVSNFPTTQNVKVIDKVDISGYVFNNDKLKVDISGQMVDISGSVSVLSLPAINITNTSFEVSNFPETQNVKVVDKVDISGYSFNGDKLKVDISGQRVDISGSVAVSSLPSIAITNTSFEVSNFPETQPISGSVAVSSLPSIAITNTSFEVSNFPETQPISGSVSVSSLPSIAITNTSFEVSNFPETQNVKVVDKVDISGYFFNNDKLKVDISGQRVDISGQRVDISGQWMNAKIYGSDNGTTFHHIKTNSNGVVATNAVIQDSNGIDLTSTLIGAKQALDVNVAGSITNNTFLVNDDGFVADVVKNDIYTLGMLCVLPCSNTGIPHSEYNPMYTMMKAKEPGGANVNLTLTELDTNIKALDVNVANTSNIGVKTNGNALKVDISGVEIFEDKLKVDVSGQRVDISGQTVILGGFDGGVNSNITNSILKVDISGVGVSGNKLKVDISGQNTLMNAYYRTGATNSNLTSVQPLGTSTVKALDTYSYTVGLNNELNIPLPITSTTGGISQALDVHIQNGSTTNDYSMTGLNVYQIIPKTKKYTFGGVDNNATAYRIIGGNPTASGIALDGASGFSFGLANARVYRASLSTGTPNSNLYIDYVDGTTGNLVENSGPYAVVATSNATNWTLLPSMVGGPIKYRTSTTIGSIADTTQALYISPDANTNRSIGHLSIANYGVAVFSIPNGYIGYITALTAGYSTAGAVIMVKWGADGVRQPVYKVNIENTLNIVVPAGYEGMIGGIFTAGESIAFTNNLATSAKLVQASITLIPV